MDFAHHPMDPVVNCTECGEFIAHCPYELPIPEVLKSNYALYREENPDWKNERRGFRPASRYSIM